MKQALIVFFAIICLTFSVHSSFAQTTTPNKRPFRETLREQRLDPDKSNFQMRMEEKREALKTRIENQRTGQIKQLESRRKDLIKKFFMNMTEMMDAAITRLEILITRIDSRIAKIQEENPSANLTSVKSELTNAKSLLSDTKADLEAAKANLDTTLNSQNPKEAFAILRGSILQVKTNLKQVHTILVHIVGDIKGLHVGQRGTVTTTVTPTITL